MYEKTLRWRLVWFVPFDIVVFAVIWSRPNHVLPAIAQATTLVFAVGFALARFRANAWAFFWHAVHYFVGASLTGALVSPLLPLGFPIVASAAILLETRRSKWLVASTFVLGTVSLVLLSKYCAWTAMSATLARDSWVIAAGTLAFAAIGLLRVGLDATDAYTELALELAARREEVFAESAEHARSLEGVAARLAHEVKNPLAAIKGLSTHMARGAGDDEDAPSGSASSRRRRSVCSPSSTGSSASRAGSTICASRASCRTTSRASSSFSSRRGSTRRASRSRSSATSAPTWSPTRARSDRRC